MSIYTKEKGTHSHGEKSQLDVRIHAFYKVDGDVQSGSVIHVQAADEWETDPGMM